MPLLFVVALLACEPPAEMAGLEITANRPYQVGDLPVSLTVTAVDGDGKPVKGFCGPAQVTGLAKPTASGTEPVTVTPPFAGGKAVLDDVLLTGEPVIVSAGTVTGEYKQKLRKLPGVLSILPPLLAIGLAIVLRQAMISLFAGIYVGALLIHGYNPLTALLRTFDTYLPKTLTDSGHAAIILFTMALGGMVGVMSRAGGTRALVAAISRRARTRRSGLITTWAAGLVVFFDDYANCLIVGNTLRPFTDSLKISREKLAYLVDSTAAPVATVALVSTWIGYQLGLLEDVLNPEGGAYSLFLNLLPYSYYSFFTIAFVLMVAITMRDFGPMLAAERRAASGMGLMRPGAVPLMDRELTEMKPADGASVHWMTAVVPVISVIVIVLIGLYATGVANPDTASDAGLREIIGNSDSYPVLLWAAFGASIIAVAMAVGSKAVRLGEAIEAWVGGLKAMLIAILILVVAWGIGDICQNHLQTGPWVLSQISPSPHFVPLITFLICAVIAFATGSSFSTMAIVIPIAAPMAWALTGSESGIDVQTVEAIRSATLAAVLSGAVFGDHCSPISDTTIMSSMAAASDHVDHVRTQAPYALLCAVVAGLCGFLPAGYGISPILCLPLGILLLGGALYALGKPAVPS